MKKNVLGLMAAMAMVACGTDNASINDGKVRTLDDNLFAGFEVTGKSWDSVGSLGVFVSDPFWGDMYFAVCTATLVGPNTILSAKHCSEGMFGSYDMYWAPGSENANDPQTKYLLVDSWLATPKSGGSIGNGSDVSVFFTDTEVTGVTPMPISAEPLTEADIDRQFFAIGYGTQNNAQDAGQQPTPGTRKLGKISLNAITGAKFPALFGTYEAYLKNLYSIEGMLFGDPSFGMDECLADPGCAASVQEMWNEQFLEGYEAYLGNRAGEAQVCHGDSGGPLVGVVVEGGTNSDSAATKKVRKVYGVASNVWFSAEQACYGNFYATFGPEVQPFLTKALAWTDPCGETTIQGACEGTVATRCTAPGEGLRRISTIDCADLDQVCAALTDGKVGCTDADGTQPGEEKNNPSPTEAKKSVSDAFTGKAHFRAKLAR